MHSLSYMLSHTFSLTNHNAGYAVILDEAVRPLPPLGKKVKVTFSIDQFMRQEPYVKGTYEGLPRDEKTNQVSVWYHYSIYKKGEMKIDVDFLVLPSRFRK